MEFNDIKEEIDTLAHYLMRDATDCYLNSRVSGLKGTVGRGSDYFVCRVCDADLVIAHITSDPYSGVEKLNIGNYVFLKIYSTYPEDCDESILIGKLPLRRRRTLREYLQSNDLYYVLTYAEEGFAPLNQHSESGSITKDQLVKFADGVNCSGEIRSLYPLAAISAIPRAYVREPALMSAQLLADQIIKFLRLNEGTIGAKKIALDFRTPDVADFVLSAIERALNNDAASLLSDAVIIIQG